MSIQVERAFGLEALGMVRTGQQHWNLSPAALYEHALRRGEASLAAEGPLVARTGQHTGRSPNDKFVVKEASSEAHVHWGAVNRPIEEEQFAALQRDMMAYLQDQDVYVLDAWAGTDPVYKLPIRVVTQFAWHNLFARNMFLPENDPARRAQHAPQFTVIDAPHFKSDPARHGTRSDVFIFVHFGKKLVLIGGTHYAGEIKKSIFTILNYTLPRQGVLSMHCSANIGAGGDTALFFGLSGTGKTTLSSDPHRRLIGDDEHGWSDTGVFNFEGGCYAKVIKLSQEAEPQIYETTRRFGTILENVVIDPELRTLDLDDASLTENTRGSYPITFIDNAELSGRGGHPTNIVMLTADAYGVLPPIARLTPEAAMYHFLSGYTARVAGTEKGVTEPKAAFSTCFGAPFLPLNPNVYAKMLGEKIAKHNAKVWLVNTGWTGGPYGVGSRMKIAHTRAMITAALSGQLDTVAYKTHAVLNLDMPATCPGVPDAVLDPRSTWPEAAKYDDQAAKLARMFTDNFKTFEGDVSAAVKAAGPEGVVYEPVIGLEIHAQLRTRTKIFCGCSTVFGAPPNSHVCPVCTGQPGALPVLNRQAVDYAIAAAVALGCQVQTTSIFARKNYFYPDLPKGYQISQYERPLALGGGLQVTVDGVASWIGLTRIHMEEDAGKSLHEGFRDSDRQAYVDYNRSGVPLIEIVSEPDMRSAAQASQFFTQLREILVWLGVNDGNMEEGSLRCDANVSVRPAGQQAFGTKAEVKNVNSFRYLQKAIEYEIERQIEVVSGGGRVRQETRLWDSSTGTTHSMRSKEEAHDYRYFPEPDLPPLVIDEPRVARIRAAMPEMPPARRRRFVADYGLPEYDAGVLTQSPELAAYYEDVAKAVTSPKAASNWVMGELLRTLNDQGRSVEDSPLGPAALAGLIGLIEKGTISGSIAKDVFATMFATGRSAGDIVAAEGLAQIGDEDAVLAIVRAVIGEHADAVAQYRAGKKQTLGFLVGQVMKRSGGKANPPLANRLLTREIDGTASSSTGQ